MTYELIDYFLSYDYTIPTSSLPSCLLFIYFPFLSWECRDIAFFLFFSGVNVRIGTVCRWVRGWGHSWGRIHVDHFRKNFLKFDLLLK